MYIFLYIHSQLSQTRSCQKLKKIKNRTRVDIIGFTNSDYIKIQNVSIRALIFITNNLNEMMLTAFQNISKTT